MFIRKAILRITVDLQKNITSWIFPGNLRYSLNSCSGKCLQKVAFARLEELPRAKQSFHDIIAKEECYLNSIQEETLLNANHIDTTTTKQF